MKKLVSVLVMSFFVVNFFYAQSTEALTNSTIIKMVKAKLSDDLIIDEINNSKVNFNISVDAIKFLSEENVSSGVILAMKIANGQPIDPLNKPANERLISETLPSQKLSKENNKAEIDNNNLSAKSTISVTAVSYVIPLAELMIFFDNEFSSLAGVIKGWDERIRISIEKGNQIKEKILQVEKELTAKKNADSKGYTNEIILLKKKLAEYRESYKQFENNMVTDGLKIAKEFEGMGNKLDRSINSKFSEISQAVKKTDPDPSVIEIPKSITIAKQKIDDNIVNYVAPVTEILFCYQNEIISLRDIIEQWNLKVMAVNKKDSELSKQLEPLEKELVILQLNPKVNKKEISALKKQCTNIEKERKLLTRQMETDSNELSGSLTKICKEVQSSVKERLNDIIENIKYSYQDNFTYRNI